MKRLIATLLAAALLLALMAAACAEGESPAIEYWNPDSPALKSITEFVEAVCDENSPEYVPAESRVAVFDSDGTLIGELFPTYFDQCLLMHRLLHDESYEGSPEEDVEYLRALEAALLSREPEPDSPRSSALMLAESFRGKTIEEYRDYIREFMGTPAVGFEGMKYGEAFYKPMTALVQYLAEHGFMVYICSGAERHMLRELTEGTLDQWIPPYRVIGTVFPLVATGQGDTAGRSYTPTADDEVVLQGDMSFKNLKMNKVASIITEIGVAPTLAFGNSSGDFAMGQYAVQNGGRAYMLLCDDTERDYGNLAVAEKFAAQCAEYGFETVSMRDEFATIYGDGVVKTDYIVETEPAEEAVTEEPVEAAATEAPAEAAATEEPAEEAATGEPAEESAEEPAETEEPEALDAAA